MANGKVKPNWIKIKNEYETSNISQRKLAEKYGVSLNTLEKRSRRELWSKSKKEIGGKITEIVRQKTIEKTAEKISDIQSDRNSRHIRIIDRVLDIVEVMLTDEQLKSGVDMFGNTFSTETISQAKVRSIMETLDKAQKGHRLAEGLDKKKETEVTGSSFEDEFKGLIDT